MTKDGGLHVARGVTSGVSHAVKPTAVWRYAARCGGGGITARASFLEPCMLPAHRESAQNLCSLAEKHIYPPQSLSTKQHFLRPSAHRPRRCDTFFAVTQWPAAPRAQARYEHGHVHGTTKRRPRSWCNQLRRTPPRC